MLRFNFKSKCMIYCDLFVLGTTHVLFLCQRCTKPLKFGFLSELTPSVVEWLSSMLFIFFDLL